VTKSKKHVVALAVGVLAAGLLWRWPARRNYYFQRDQVTRRLDVAYTSDASDPKRQLDLYLPRDLPRGAGAGVPVVVFVHGGYWSPLDRRWMQPLLGAFGNVGVAFARHGVAAAIVGYRQYPRVQTGDASLDDLANAIRFVQASCPSWGCDPRRTFVVGHSAGGHLVSLLALDERVLRRNGVDPAAVAGYVSLDGLFDVEKALASFKPEQAAIVRQLFGPDDAALAAHSPISYARATHPPLLVVDSTGDEPVCRDAFRQMKARMAAVGSPATFVELPGLGHNEAILRVGTDDDPVMPVLLRVIH
jgi:arylformamidase